ncbi:DUF397 domain-containing protein [Amycolatopsis nigrescens]|uniref:DUF397 domain-containing protein n=1 Tax=Amycolatopsis nigrescens TaxID=381445 RepID=UPI000475E8C1|nr:DUF397 domain-containing protein [Amycolatopsis nigrescens]
MNRDLPGAEWRKSSYSNGSDPDNCVEVAFVSGGVAVRDTKNRAAGYLAVSPVAWSVFTALTAPRTDPR